VGVSRVRDSTLRDLSRQEVYGYRVSWRVDLNAKGRPLRHVNSEMVQGSWRHRGAAQAAAGGRNEKSGAENRFQWGTLAELCPRRHDWLRCISWLFFITARGNTYKYVERAIFPSIERLPRIVRRMERHVISERRRFTLGPSLGRTLIYDY